MLLLVLLGLTVSTSVEARAQAGCDCSTRQGCEQCSFNQVVQAMVAKEHDIATQTHGCAKLALRGTALPRAEDSLAHSVEAVTGAIKTFPADQGKYVQLAAIPSYSKLLELHQSCCEALAKLAGIGSQQAQAQQAGGVELVTAAMLAFPSEQPLQAKALAALGNILQGNVPAQNAAYSGGSMHAALAAMVAFPDSTVVQENGCHALVGMAQRGERGEELRDEIGAAGGIATIVGAMQKHTSRWMLQEFCCSVLFELVAGGGTTHSGHAATAVAVGAVEVAEIASKKHKHAQKCGELAEKLVVTKQEL